MSAAGSEPSLSMGPPPAADTCGSWPLQVAPQLSRVRGAVGELARRRYAHPSLDTPEASLVGVFERLALVVSELGGNALRHAQAPVTVSLARLRHGWLLSVADGDVDHVPRLEQPDEESGNLHGLHVVATISEDVGWYVEDSVKLVWATISDTAPEGLVARLVRG